MRTKRLILCATLLATIFATASCGNNAVSNEEQDTQAEGYNVVTFPVSFENLSGMDSDALKEYLEENGDGNYEELTVSEGLVQISVTEEQEEYWKDYVQGKIDAQESVLTDVSPKYKASCNDSFDTISVYYDTMISFNDAFEYIGKTAIYCAMHQLFDGNEDYSVSLNIYNVDTGKLVAGGDLQEDDISYDDTEWSVSYTLTDEEAASIQEADSGEQIPVKSTFVDGMSVIDILQAAAGNDYQSIYIDSDGVVQLKADETQMQTMIANLEQYLNDIADQFEGLGEGYEISWNTDYSAITYRFDAALSKQEQANYVVYAETICMLHQLLESDSYYIDLSIYDSASGELISEGNTEDGITWDIGGE